MNLRDLGIKHVKQSWAMEYLKTFAVVSWFECLLSSKCSWSDHPGSRWCCYFEVPETLEGQSWLLPVGVHPRGSLSVCVSWALCCELYYTVHLSEAPRNGINMKSEQNVCCPGLGKQKDRKLLFESNKVSALRGELSWLQSNTNIPKTLPHTLKSFLSGVFHV